MPREKSKTVTEFGDFQTPLTLATQICQLLRDKSISPQSLLEPTCGRGNFLVAANKVFPHASQIVGYEINSDYTAMANQQLPNALIKTANFFELNWSTILGELPKPLLVLGNPPWVTNSELGTLESNNVPNKTNLQNYRGLDALTGKSNFDISEWMLIRLMEALSGQDAKLAMLCKTSVARKVLFQAWDKRLSLSAAEIHKIDAKQEFDAAVDACLLYCDFSRGRQAQVCRISPQLGSIAEATLGFHEGRLLADAKAYQELKHLEGESPYRWRSGVKHDCQKVMEFQKAGNQFLNGLGLSVEIEDRYLFPMRKSSELANQEGSPIRRWMLIPQTSVGQETRNIEQEAPLTWDYLLSHAKLLDHRKSSIYKNRPRFSVFGVGKYTFSPWKVAISGFYKRLDFSLVGPHQGKPTVLDDTAYFVDCHSQREAELICTLLNSEMARRFYSAFLFWDAKRPITATILKRLDLQKLAQELNRQEELKACRPDIFHRQRNLF